MTDDPGAAPPGGAQPEHEDPARDQAAAAYGAQDAAGHDPDAHDPGASDPGASDPGEHATSASPLDAAEDPRTREELLAELREAEARRDEYLEDVRRARAELDNFRKRTMREGAQQRDNARAEVVGRLLEVLDDLDRMLEAARTSSDPALAKGVTLVADKLVEQLAGLGLERIDALEVPFDPTRHEAVQQLPAEVPTDHPVVVQVLRPGYQVGDRVIRAAMVVVAQ